MLARILNNNSREIKEILRIWLLSKIGRKQIPYLTKTYGKSHEACEFCIKTFKRGRVLASHNLMKDSYAVKRHVALSYFERILCHDDVFLLVDSNFLFYHDNFQDLILKKNKDSVFILKSNEKIKTLTTIKTLLSRIPYPRTKMIFGIGGGLISDITGFLAGLLDIHYMLMPTTFLSMIDASLGGKTAVNFPPFGKNLVGLFYHPLSVYYLPILSRSEERAHIISGFGEYLKHVWLSRSVFHLKLIEKLLKEKLTHISLPTLEEILKFNLETKNTVVKRDPGESDFRRILNFGHTLGHLIEELAYEKHIHYENIPHGICIIYGMKFLFDSHIMTLNTLHEKLFYKLLTEVLRLWNPKIRLKFKGDYEDFYNLCKLKLLNDKKSFFFKSQSITLVTPTFSILKKNKNSKSYITRMNLRYFLSLVLKKIFF